MKLLSVAVQTELIASKMDFTSTIAATNISNVTTTAQPPLTELYDPLWAIILRWTIGGIIVLVGKLIKINKLTFLAFCRLPSEKKLLQKVTNSLTTSDTLLFLKTDARHVQNVDKSKITCKSLFKG